MSDNSVPPPPLDSTSQPLWAKDNRASSEVKLWDKEDELKGQKHKNDMIWLKVYGLIVPSMMVCFSLLYIITLTVYFIHFVTIYGWLSPDQLSKIQSLIFSGSIGAFVASVANKQNPK